MAFTVKIIIPNAPKEYDQKYFDDILRALRLAFNQINTVRIDAPSDIIIDSDTSGLVLRDTQATPHYWRVRVNNVGTLVTTDLGTSKPN